MLLPKIRLSNLSGPVWQLQDWVNAGPWAPDGDWYKDFGSFMLCGSGEFPKTVLAKGMAPFGTRIE